MRNFVILLLAGGLLVGCKPGSSRLGQAGESSTAAKEAPKVAKDEQVCFECNASGRMACGTGGCQAGQMECPSPCLKLSRGKWEHMDMAGHKADELWQKYPNGPGRTIAWNHHHVGEVVLVENGVAHNAGQCQTCLGSTKVKCKMCNGQGTQTCYICDGKTVVPASWTVNSNPKLASQPDLIRLRDGRSVLGRIAIQAGKFCTIRTRDGKMIEVNSADIVSKGGQ
jgi:hypothetical protein